MAIPQFQRRFRCAHAFSVVAAFFAVGAAAVFVFIRIQRTPTPSTPEAEVPAVVDGLPCSCTCGKNNELLCARTGENGTDPELAVLNKTGCFLGVTPVLSLMGPKPTARNCSCTEEGFVCRATFEYELMNVQWVTRASIVQLAVAFVVLIWDVHYLVALYFFVLPSAPEDTINMEWLHHWLKGYWDPLHSAALWTIWGQVLGLGIAPVGVQSPFPRLREFASSSKQIQAGLGPTGIDELVLWCAAALLAVAALALMCATPSTAFDENAGVNGQQQAPQKVEDPQQPCANCIWPMLAGVLLLASLGFIVGQPMSLLYAVFATVPCWLLQAYPRWHSPWPLERPFPGLLAPWVLPAKEHRNQEEALRLVEELEAHQTEKHRSQTDFGGRVQGLCRRVKKLQEAVPWRAPLDLDTRLQVIVLNGLRGAVEMRNACEMRRLLRAARLLGYCAPPADDEEEEMLEAQTQSRKGCCGRLVGYQRLGEDRKGAPLVRDEAWSADVYETLRGGLRSAVDAARVLEDDVSLRWLGDILTALRPEAMPELCAQLARAADTLTGLIDDTGWEPGELYRTLGAAAGLQPDAEGPSGMTALGWAMGLRTQHMRGTMALLLDRLPDNGRTSAGDSLKVVEGPPEGAIIQGMRAFTGQAITLAAPDLAVGGGRWFFEVQLHGHSSAPSAAEIKAGLFGVSCRFGWLHEADCHQRQHSNGSAASFKGLSVKSSCNLGAIDTGTNDLEFAYHPTPGRGVIGCALEISGNKHRAWYALDGVWNSSGAAWDENSEDVSCNSWSASDADGPVCPAVSGRLVCHLAFLASHYVHGPPDPSFRPIAEAAGMTASVHESTSMGAGPTTFGAAFEPANPDVFEIGDDQC